MNKNDANFKQWRIEIGFSNKEKAKAFFKATDIHPGIDLELVDRRNIRVYQIAEVLNSGLHSSVSHNDLGDLKLNYIEIPKKKIIDTKLILKLNNNGRRYEDVYLSWLRGYVISGLMIPAIKSIFGVGNEAISSVGGDDFDSKETFKRLPAADLEIDLPSGNKVRIEVQAGFQGVNDIKQHKLKQAADFYRETSIPTLVLHIDALNGQGAVIPCQKLDLEKTEWIERAQMEGQKVLAIQPEQFNWWLNEVPPSITEEELF
jgi:hypothetical protein